jgi:hypothetical protein
MLEKSITVGPMANTGARLLALVFVGSLIGCSGGGGSSSSSGGTGNPPPATNHAPTISGSPPTTAKTSVAYSFRPTASDADGDALTFQISSKPSWATFNATTGALTGTPGASAVGTYSSIQILVSDGKAQTALPTFAITVSPASSTNRAPTISGTPATSVTVGQAYSFQPSASDPDGQTLAFGIANKPSWATFNTSTGRLSGTPTAAGTTSNIVISVSDGSLSATLPAFTLTVTAAVTGSATLSWTAPTQNTDGTALTNLAGYKIRYGKSAATLDQVLDIPSAGITSATIEGLASGTWYFTMSSYTNTGVESSPTGAVSKTI